MSGPEIVLVVVLAVLVVGFLLVLAASVSGAKQPVPMLPDSVTSRMRVELFVTMKSGEGFRGILWEADDRAWVLRSAAAVGEGENHTDLPVDGEIILMVPDIAYAQKP